MSSLSTTTTATVRPVSWVAIVNVKSTSARHLHVKTEVSVPSFTRDSSVLVKKGITANTVRRALTIVTLIRAKTEGYVEYLMPKVMYAIALLVRPGSIVKSII